MLIGRSLLQLLTHKRKSHIDGTRAKWPYLPTWKCPSSIWFPRQSPTIHFILSTVIGFTCRFLESLRDSSQCVGDRSETFGAFRGTLDSLVLSGELLGLTGLLFHWNGIWVLYAWRLTENVEICRKRCRKSLRQFFRDSQKEGRLIF